MLSKRRILSLLSTRLINSIKQERSCKFVIFFRTHIDIQLITDTIHSQGGGVL